MNRAFGLLIAVFATRANAIPVTLTWDAPSSYSPAGYIVGYGQASGAYSTAVDVGNTRTYTVPNLDVGTTYYVSVMAYGSQGVSTWATEVVVTPLQAPLPTSASLTPAIGLWGSSAESGTGYSLDFKHGVLVVTVYSYNADGSAQWYLSSGPLSGTTFVSELYKFAAGQCLSCAYAGPPSALGSDGTITIRFSSPRSATVELPGGRVTQISPTEF